MTADRRKSKTAIERISMPAFICIAIGISVNAVLLGMLL